MGDCFFRRRNDKLNSKCIELFGKRYYQEIQTQSIKNNLDKQRGQREHENQNDGVGVDEIETVEFEQTKMKRVKYIQTLRSGDSYEQNQSYNEAGKEINSERVHLKEEDDELQENNSLEGGDLNEDNMKSEEIYEDQDDHVLRDRPYSSKLMETIISYLESLTLDSIFDQVILEELIKLKEFINTINSSGISKQQAFYHQGDKFSREFEIIKEKVLCDKSLNRMVCKMTFSAYAKVCIRYTMNSNLKDQLRMIEDQIVNLDGDEYEVYKQFTKLFKDLVPFQIETKIKASSYEDQNELLSLLMTLSMNPRKSLTAQERLERMIIRKYQLMKVDGFQITDIEMDNARLQKENINLKKRISTYITTCTDLKSQIFQQSDEMLRQEDRNNRLESSNARLEASNARLEASNAKLEASDARLEARNARLEASNARLEANNAIFDSKFTGPEQSINQEKYNQCLNGRNVPCQDQEKV
eukprot:403359758